jgi:thermitase
MYTEKIRICMMSRFIHLIPCLLLLAGSSHGAFLRMEGDRLTLRAENEPIGTVLAAFARQGVRVKLDPAVNATVSVNLNRQRAETVLEAMLTDCDYVALWKQAKGPLGPIPVLEELQVFKPGRKEAIRPLQTGAQPPRVRIREYMAGELLVRVSTNASPDLFLALVARYGGRVADSIPGMGLYKIVFPEETDIPRLAAELKQQSLIASVEPNYVYRLPAGLAPLPSSGPALQVTPGKAGGPPLVAVLDTGYGIGGDPLMSWLDATGGSADPVDDHGHGTEMSLLAAGRIQPMGNPAATQDSLLPVLAVRIADQGEFVAGDTLMKSLQAALDQKVRVVSLSWGSDMDSAYLKEVLDKAVAQNVVVVAAAGNSPTGSPVYPAAFPGVLAVAGTKSDGTPAEWSNYGSFVDIAAPGYAPLPGKSSKISVGTSVSTAYVANILGRYFQLHPTATAEQAVAAAKAAVTKTDWDSRYGSGVLDTAAIDRLLK